MQFSLDDLTASLSVGDFAAFALGPHDGGKGGAQGLWRAQLGQHWHNELRAQVERAQAASGTAPADVRFEVPVAGTLRHRDWSLTLAGRIDQLVVGTVREIKTVLRPLPADEAVLRADYPEHFRQLATYVVLLKSAALAPGLIVPDVRTIRAELVFVEAGSGLAQTIALTIFDEALVHHQLDAVVEFLELQRRARERRRRLQFQPPFPTLREGQETIQTDLAAILSPHLESGPQSPDPRAQTLFFEAPTGFGKTGCLLEFALGQLQSGQYSRLIWLTGKSTGQLQVIRTLSQMTAPNDSGDPTGASNRNGPLPFWQIRNKGEHCVNHTFHCVRDGCTYLEGCAERWPGSGLARFYLDETQPRDLDTLRSAGRAARICPYEITRAALAFNDVWIGDYNYVFAPDNRGLFFDQPGFDPSTTLLLIDEAHNLPSRVADALSHRATDGKAQLLLAELDHLRAPNLLVLAVEEWVRLLATLEPADSLDPVLETEIHDLLGRLARLTETTLLDYTALGQTRCETLWSFATLSEWMQSNGSADRPESRISRLLWCPRPGELLFTCTDASTVIGATLRRFGGAILMSATLQPYETFAVTCGLATGRPTLPPMRPDANASENGGGLGTARPTYATLHAHAPWRDSAYDIAVDRRVDTSFKQRANHHGTTAATIEQLHAAAHSPLAVFFPSYAYAETVLRVLENSGTVLRVAMQPKMSDLAAQSAWVEESLVLTDALFLVLGSSFAEGIDLLGGRVTHAMVVGPALPEVNAVQKARMNQLAGLGRDDAFRRVYQLPGLQKVNQALGRLVRAPGQRAKVLLHCRRFADPTYSSLLAMEYQFYREIATDTDLREWLGHAD